MLEDPKGLEIFRYIFCLLTPLSKMVSTKSTQHMAILFLSSNKGRSTTVASRYAGRICPLSEDPCSEWPTLPDVHIVSQEYFTKVNQSRATSCSGEKNSTFGSRSEQWSALLWTRALPIEAPECNHWPVSALIDLLP